MTGEIAQPARILLRQIAGAKRHASCLPRCLAGSCAPRCQDRGRPAAGRSRVRRASSTPLDQRPGRVGGIELGTTLGRRRGATPTSRASCRCRACRCRRPSAPRGSRADAGWSGRGRARTAGRPSPGSRARRRSRTTGSVITPRSSATTGSWPSSRSTASEQRRRPGRGATCHAPPSCRRRARPSRRRSRGNGRPASGRRARSVRRKRSIHQR